MINKQSRILQSDNIVVRPLKVIDVTDEYVYGLNDPDVRQHRLLTDDEELAARAHAMAVKFGGIICQSDGAAYEFRGSYVKHNSFVIARDKDLSD